MFLLYSKFLSDIGCRLLQYSLGALVSFFVCSNCSLAEILIYQHDFGHGINSDSHRNSHESLPELGSLMLQYSGVSPQKNKGALSLGLGIGYADFAPENSTWGTDVLLGFENRSSKKWIYGAQVHFLNGTVSSNPPNSENTSINLNALYVTARSGRWLKGLQFKAGVVDVSYTNTPPYYSNMNQNTAWSGTGVTVGVGIVGGGENFQWHVLDVEQCYVAGRSFTVYSVSIAVIFGLLVL